MRSLSLVLLMIFSQVLQANDYPRVKKISVKFIKPFQNFVNPAVVSFPINEEFAYTLLCNDESELSIMQNNSWVLKPNKMQPICTDKICSGDFPDKIIDVVEYDNNIKWEGNRPLPRATTILKGKFKYKIVYFTDEKCTKKQTQEVEFSSP